ncbi:hypothetical protein DFO70_12546 [Cytobacillus firmus]|uniref:DUF4367 domain-containing protein n=2 Tax=Cytobacillus TaxID=2675230 RepID=A0A366JHU1_CYTFI|nr:MULTISPECIES: hypothetical protein [Cytobacillus]RBP86578.1 hypothetical protein DFO70_12546 [Cytobacillus firmus]TDX39319.1 hypothetical protein DFO72_111150 [Cytobacillus oceanisediminis]
MDDFKQQMKTSLDESVFNGLDISPKDKMRFIQQVKSKAHQKKSGKRMPFYPQLVAAVMVLLITGVLLKTFTGADSGTAAFIEKEAEAVFGKDLIIPEFKQFEISFAAITIPEFLDKPSDLSISYSDDKKEIDPVFDEDEEKVKWEKAQESKLLYGPYSGKEYFRIQYRSGQVEPGDSNEVKKKTINGIPLEYQYINKESGEFVFAYINHNGGAYLFEFNLGQEFTKTDADQVLEEFVEQLE